MLTILLGVVLVMLAGGCVRSPEATDAPRESSSHVQPLEGANRASVRIQFGGGALTVGALEGHADTLSSMTYAGPAALRPEPSYRVGNGGGELAYSTGNTDHGQAQAAEMHVQLAPAVPLALSIESGAAKSNLDLTGLHVTQLGLQLGASSARVRLPDAAGLTTVNVEAGAASLAFEVPPDVAADVQISGALDARDIDEARFRPLGGGRYRSPEYDAAFNRVDLHLELGAANVTVH